MLDHFSDFVKFILVLSETFPSSLNLLLVVQQKFSPLHNYCLANQLLIVLKKWLRKCQYLPTTSKVIILLCRLIHSIMLAVNFLHLGNDGLLHPMIFFSKNFNLVNIIIRYMTWNYWLLLDGLGSRDLSKKN